MPRSVVFLLLALLCAPTPEGRAHPSISERSIVNAASFMPASLKGGAIARGSIFTIFGSAIGPAIPVQAVEFPLKATLAGVTITVAQQNVVVQALPVYVSEGQINAIMPSTAPLGAVTLQLQFNDGDGSPASSPVRAEVVEASFGIFTATRRGVGPSIAFNFETEQEQPLNATTRSARPGQVIVLWGTGLGPVMGGDDRPPGEVGAVDDLQAQAQVEVWVGGARADTILYAGRSPLFAGLDQINFIVPQGASKGCYAPVWVKVAGDRVSNVTTLSIADAPGACTDPLNPYLSPGVGSRLGLVIPQRLHLEVGGAATTIDTASASFQTMVIREFFYNPALSLPPRGTCLVRHPTPSEEEDGFPHERPAGALEAGARMTLSGHGDRRELTRTGVGYYESLLEEAFLSAGGYTVESAGGTAVAAFQDSFAVGDPPTFRLPGDGSTVRRDRSITVSWAGGDPQTEIIRILGVVASSAVASARIRATFLCTATPEQGFLEIPADILSNLPASLGSGASSTALLYVGTSPLPETSRFEAAGLDFGAVTPVVMRGKPISVQ
jgi:uncharacterized protein (TIGR03437 family)